MEARGYSRQQVQAMVRKFPALLYLDLDSPLQQQKLEGIQTVSPWTVGTFLSVPTYFASVTTRRLASRLDFLLQHELSAPASPGKLVVLSDARFLADVGKQLARQGRKLAVADWRAWEDSWLKTEAGRKWGFPPLKY